jgi:acetyl-CoA synthetase
MTPADRAIQLFAVFDDPDACAAELLCDRHDPASAAFFFVDAAGKGTAVSFSELRERSVRFASALASLGVRRGDRVATLMGKGLDLVTVILGAWRLGAVYVPLFTAFSTGALELRLQGSQAKVIVVDPDQRDKLASATTLSGGMLSTIVVTGPDPLPHAEDLALPDLLATGTGDAGAPARIGGNGALVHMFTSGTTGKPKGVVHPLSYAAGWQVYLEYALGVTHEGRYWCAADPGWAYGLYSAIVAPLAAGIPSLLASGNFSVTGTWQILAEHHVTDFAAAPTVYRALAAATAPIPDQLHLRRASSAGEPLTPDVNTWAQPALGVTVHDHFGQTELGMVLANHHHPDLAQPIRPGSMGRAVPGWQMTVLHPAAEEPADTDQLGRLAVDIERSPLMTFHGYHGGAASASKFTADRRYYLTGDSARIDADGDFFFSSRDDDVIIMAGYRIGPFEIEAVLSEHPAVVECAIIAVPDKVRGEGHCCVGRSRMAGDWFGDHACHDFVLCRFPVPAGGDLGRGPLVPALRPALPRRGRTAGRARRRRGPRHRLPLGPAVHARVHRGSPAVPPYARRPVVRR